MMPIIIALKGKKKSGKTLSAKYAESLYGFTIESFAKPIKQISNAFGFSRDEIYGARKETANVLLGITCREFMQKFGTELCKSQLFQELFKTIGAEPWIRLLSNRYSEMKAANDKAGKKTFVIIDDLRFPAEADFIRSIGGSIIEITRIDDEKDDNKGNKDTENKDTENKDTENKDIEVAIYDSTKHASEILQDQIVPDYIIENDASIGSLYLKIDYTINSIITGKSPAIGQ